MARIRTLKPEFWTHEELSALPEPTHILAGALLNYADDFGYFNANPGLVKASCSPLREPSVSIPESLRSLHALGYIRLGTASDGKRYGQVVHFDMHQRVSHPSPSKISALSITWDSSGISPESLRNPPETFRPEQGTGNREQGDQSSLRSDSPSPDGDGVPTSIESKKAERLTAVTADAVAAYNACLGKPNGLLAAVHLVNEVRQNQVKRCLGVAREICSRQYGGPVISPQFWADYFAECRRDPFLAGEVKGGKGHENYTPDFELLTRKEKMTAVFDKAMSEAAA